MARFTIGYQPSGNPRGYGDPASGTMRGTTFAGRPKAYWIYELGAHMGKWDAANVSGQIAAYQADKSSWAPGELLGKTDDFTVGVTMRDSQSGGRFARRPQAAILVPASTPVTLAVNATGGNWAHGQDHSGAIMYERGGVADPPVTFVSTNTRPEGTIAVWGGAQEDVAPYIPLWTPETLGVSPGHGNSTTDETPTIAFDFRSDNEALGPDPKNPIIQIGDADKLTRYQVQVWNRAKTTKLHDSNVQNATPAMITGRRVEWTVPDALAPASYTIRAQVYNSAGTKSAWLEWVIHVVGAGSITLDGPTGITNDTTPDITWSYSHRQALSMDKMVVRVESTKGDVIRPDFTFDFTADPVDPSTGTFHWDDTPWAALTPGFDYVAKAQAIDTDGQPSPWSGGTTFHVNAPPQTPNFREPLPGSVLTAIPDLVARCADVDDPSPTLSPVFYVRKVGETAETAIAGHYDTQTQRWKANPLSGGAIAPGDFGHKEWRVQATDPHGAVGPSSSWLSFEYAAPPTVTAVSPVGTITTSNPAFTWTVDRAQTSYRMQLFDGTTGAPIRNGDSGWVASASTEHGYHDLLLRNLQQVNVVLDVITTGEIPGRLEWTFDVAYTPPPQVTGFTATPHVGRFDDANTPTQIHTAWEAVTTDEVAFDSYRVRRRNLATGETILMATLSATDETSWYDDEAGSGVAYEYSVTQAVWIGLDLVESIPVIAQASVTLPGVVLSIVAGGEGRAVLKFWQDRTTESVEGMEIRETWASKPRAISSPLRYRRVQGQAVILGDHADVYDVSERMEALRALTEPVRTAAGKVAKPTICYRDNRGRVFYGVLAGLMEDDTTRPRLYTVDLTITETDFAREVQP